MRLWLVVTMSLVGAFVQNLTHDIWLTLLGCVTFFFIYVPLYAAAWAHLRGRE